MKKTNKGQTFSADLLIVVIILLFGVLFLVMNKISTTDSQVQFEEKYEEASEKTKIVVSDLKKKKILNQNNEVDVEKLLQLDESQIKQELGITGDFAIVFEKDGKLVKIDPENNINCVGSNKIIVNDEVCQ